MSLSIGRDYEPDLVDLLSYAPFAASYSLAEYCQQPWQTSYWHGLWIVPLSCCVNVVATGWLLIAAGLNALAAVVLSRWADACSVRRFTSAYEAVILAGVTVVRSFYPVYLVKVGLLPV